jgi:hypothetical protein
MIDIISLARHLLLLLDSGYSVRRLFTAACRVADVEPTILLDATAANDSSDPCRYKPRHVDAT